MTKLEFKPQIRRLLIIKIKQINFFQPKMTTSQLLLRPLPITIGPYTLVQSLGDGGTAVVFKAISDNGNFALKVFERQAQNTEQVQLYMANEVESLLLCSSHKNIVKLVDSSYETSATDGRGNSFSCAYIALEMLPSGDLFDLV